jgi:hypothetical protein
VLFFIKVKPYPSLFQNLILKYNRLKRNVTYFPFPKKHLLPLKKTFPKDPLSRALIVLAPYQLDIRFISFPEPTGEGLFVSNNFCWLEFISPTIDRLYLEGVEKQV